MRVLLVHPSPLMYSEIFLRLEPLGLERVAQAVRMAGHDVRIIDLQTFSHAELYSEFARFRPNAVGISLNYLANVPEVIDLATLKPYDEQTVLGSIAKTGRCVIVHEAARTGGFGAEIAALIAERGLLSLLAPVIRVTGYDTVIPLPRLERYYMPSVARIVAAARKACKFAESG